MVIKDYIKEYIRITLSSIKTPEAFFRGIPDKEQNSAKPAVYLILSIVFCLIFRPEIFYLISGAINPIYDPSIYLYILLILFIIIAFILFLSLIYITLMHFVIRLIGGIVKIEDTFMVFCYSVSPLNIIWILNFLSVFPGAYDYYSGTWIYFLFSLLWIGCILYILYIMITGISVRSGITKPRAFAAAFVQPLVIILVFLFMIFIPSQTSYQPGIEQPVWQEVPYVGIEAPPQRYDLTAYRGSAPVIDGIISGDDRWNEGMNVQMDVRDTSYLITAKHDRENLYVMMQWKGSPAWNDTILLLLKQDDAAPGMNMNTGRIDMYSLKYGHAIFEDWHFVDDFTSAEHQDGSANVSYNYNIREMAIEWKIPLNSGDNYDIYINKYPARLGFSIVNDRDGGIFPVRAHQYDPATWADLEIVDVRKP
ncbi:MAG: YIP1 family protein [Euryarchaeota archaeon]|nr:YIP1 family protein [Euryarchaeota archaeon]